MNLFHLLDQAALRFPERGAVFVGSRQVHDFSTLRDRALRLAAALGQQGAAGERIVVASPNKPQYVELLFGIWAAGMAAVPVNAKLHPNEIAQILEDSGTSAVFASREIAAALAAMPGAIRAGCRLVDIDSDEYERLLRAEPAPAPRSAPDALAWLFYTSGTTGRSKGAMLTHRNLLAMTISHLADVEQVDEDASLVHSAPMSHGSGLYILPYVSRGARQVVPESEGFDPDEFLGLCDAHPGCSAFLAPTMVRRVCVAAERDGRVPANLRTIVYGGGPMYVDDLKRALAIFGQSFVQIFGQGEAPMTITWLRRRDHESPDDAVLGSVGCARTGVEVAVVDDDGLRLPAGEPGEIVCRGDVVMAGYWNNPDATAAALRDGWLHTGDVGSFDDRGYLTLRDRSKDVVISGGSNVYPREVEEALLSHPSVAEACVVGQKDPEWGEIVVAFVVPEPGARIDEQALGAHCLDRIARFKRPKRYLFVAALPKNSYGKVLKRELRRLLPG